MFDRIDRWLLLRIKAAFVRGGSPEHVGRGFGAGVFAAFFPLSAVRFVVSLIAAFIFRGNRAAALALPAIGGLFEYLALTQLPATIAGLFWSSRARELARRADEFRAVNLDWNWLRPWVSLQAQFQALKATDPADLLALTTGSMLTGGIIGALTYPLIVIAMSFFYDAKIRAKNFMLRGEPAEALLPFEIPEKHPGHKFTDQEYRERYCGRNSLFTDADTVRLLEDGAEAYPEMLGAIAEAKDSVLLETYIFRSDKFGTFFAAALKDAAQRGVKTQLVADGFGTLSMAEGFLEDMANSGVEVRLFHPLSAFWRGGLGFLQRRDHRKLLIIDGRISLLGGLNIANEYAAKEDGGDGWRDTHVRIDGAAIASQLTTIFNEAWSKGETIAKTAAALPHVPHHDEPVEHVSEYLKKKKSALRQLREAIPKVPVQTLSNRELLERLRIKRAYVRAINASQRYILIENAFFIPDRQMLRALYAAQRRGVVIALVVTMCCDVLVAHMAARALYDELLSHGIRIFEYPKSMLHAKIAVVDDRWSIVSSYNLNQRSLIHDLEVGALFYDQKFSETLRTQILSHIKECKEVTLPMHRSRPWNVAVVESFCYLFRYWL